MPNPNSRCSRAISGSSLVSGGRLRLLTLLILWRLSIILSSSSPPHLPAVDLVVTYTLCLLYSAIAHTFNLEGEKKNKERERVSKILRAKQIVYQLSHGLPLTDNCIVAFWGRVMMLYNLCSLAQVQWAGSEQNLTFFVLIGKAPWLINENFNLLQLFILSVLYIYIVPIYA